ncbi:MAG: hypothetical protein R3261_14655 [Alphaproteobacteria bacterium]|nr:hypothetical protein [Alphaproteobacteria bacterium]
MGSIEELEARLDQALMRLENNIQDRLTDHSSKTSSNVSILEDEVTGLRMERDRLETENAMLRQDAAGLVRRLDGAIKRLDTVLTEKES